MTNMVVYCVLNMDEYINISDSQIKETDKRARRCSASSVDQGNSEFVERTN